MYEHLSLKDLIDSLNGVEGQSKDLFVHLFTGNIYPLDLFIGGILNRVLNLNASFVLLLEHHHYLSAASLVRVQLDTLMRLNSINLVSEPQELASKVLEGIQINTLVDKEGNLMRDGYLKKKLSEFIPWSKNVYDKTSGFIHFSDSHIFANMKSGTGRNIQMSLSSKDFYIPDVAKLEATICMIEINRNILNVISGYVSTKVITKNDL